MGERGPARKPTALTVLHGDKREIRKRAREPRPSTAEVKVPRSLGKQARAVWAELAPDLIRKNVLTAWDVAAFAELCNAIVYCRKAARALEREGAVVKVPVFNRDRKKTGERLAKNPWWQAWKEADERFLRLAARFGLTPADRAELDVAPPRPEDPADDLT